MERVFERGTSVSNFQGQLDNQYFFRDANYSERKICPPYFTLRTLMIFLFIILVIAYFYSISIPTISNLIRITLIPYLKLFKLLNISNENFLTLFFIVISIIHISIPFFILRKYFKNKFELAKHTYSDLGIITINIENSNIEFNDFEGLTLKELINLDFSKELDSYYINFADISNIKIHTEKQVSRTKNQDGTITKNVSYFYTLIISTMNGSQSFSLSSEDEMKRMYNIINIAVKRYNS